MTRACVRRPQSPLHMISVHACVGNYYPCRPLFFAA